MHVPFVDLAAQYNAHREEFDGALAAVIASPEKMLIKTATMIRAEPSASHKIPIRNPSDTRVLSSQCSLSVPNSSSWIGIEPVRRTLAR